MGHDVAVACEIVPDEFGQHLNTSRKSSSTLFAGFAADGVDGGVPLDAAVLQEDHLVEHLLDIRDEVGGEDDGGILVVVADDGAENVVAGGGLTPPTGSSSRYSFVARDMTRMSWSFRACP